MSPTGVAFSKGNSARDVSPWMSEPPPNVCCLSVSPWLREDVTESTDPPAPTKPHSAPARTQATHNYQLPSSYQVQASWQRKDTHDVCLHHQRNNRTGICKGTGTHEAYPWRAPAAPSQQQRSYGEPSRSGYTAASAVALASGQGAACSSTGARNSKRMGVDTVSLSNLSVCLFMRKEAQTLQLEGTRHLQGLLLDLR